MSQPVKTTGVIPFPKDPSSAPKPPTKTSRLERSNAKWDSHKTEIYQMYVDQNLTLKETMNTMESKHAFKASLRKWKMKIKEWNFEKNLPANEMAFIAAKAEKRKAEDGKETVFYRGDVWIGPERIENFKKRRLTATDMADFPIIVDTPANVTYHTPPAQNDPFNGEYLLLELDEEPGTAPSLYHEGQGRAQDQDQDKDPGAIIHICERLENNLLEGVDATARTSQGSMHGAIDGPETPTETLEIATAGPSYRRSSTSDISQALDTSTSPTVPESKSTDTIGDDNKNTSSSVIIISAEAILDLLHGLPAIPIDPDVFLGILERLPTLSTSHAANDIDEVKEHEGNLICDDKFFHANAIFVKDSIDAALKLPLELAVHSSVLSIATAKNSSIVRSKLLSLLENIRASDEYCAKGFFIDALVELAEASVSYLRFSSNRLSSNQLSSNQLSSNRPTYRIHIELAVRDLAGCIVKHLPNETTWDQGFFTRLPPTERLRVLASLADDFYQSDFLEAAEILFRHLIIQIQLENSDGLCVHHSFREELARLSIISLVRSFMHHYPFNVTGLVDQHPFRLAASRFHEVWEIYHGQEDEDDEDQNPGQQIKILSRTFFEYSGQDDQIMMFSKVVLLGNLCSRLGWHETANHVFELSLNHKSFPFEVLDWNLSREKACGHAWHALNLQRQEDWPNSVKALYDGYKELACSKLISTEKGDYLQLVMFLRSVLEKVPQPLTAEALDLIEYDKTIDEHSKATWERNYHQVFVKPNVEYIRTSTVPASVSSFLGGISSVPGSMSTGRYGVTYSDSVGTEVSLNYSALFPWVMTEQ
ncbi:hypothetical protein IFR05_003754 [Cadophora sp. M221]|nr:hypothetical protein IFR05_003754 [Cadophora sp. M221]